MLVISSVSERAPDTATPAGFQRSLVGNVAPSIPLMYEAQRLPAVLSYALRVVRAGGHDPVASTCSVITARQNTIFTHLNQAMQPSRPAREY